MIIREIREDDAILFLDLQKTIEEETQFMLLESGERETAVAEKRKLIRAVLNRDNQTVFVVENNDGRLVGYLRALGGEYEKSRHTAYITMGVLQEFTGQGLGTRLLETLDEWAQHNGIHRLELIVMQPNKAAIGLYEKMGYEIEGTKRDSLFIDGVYVDEYYMGKLLPKS
ncbi:GNAT family N-acetyltransferase [Dethiobacter alkaliphilus]|uniref:GCN5-related N-acetyltransferase n=1 Tax=Dethiobacter alkaliphilus AHT 1 TaxID=555088 RepID=C0GJZ6_DETAL|nr:GNAT family N-acetyltransferase [Dethiobacter alkaliphilus]EEG76365.1 GCN5-related N-acetyltransferase [Dethiobacter alkaliphilus AHT 1]MCW3489811.1 GNAT family N-acetyltransferase [Dethiobacter alkaliphilus]